MNSEPAIQPQMHTDKKQMNAKERKEINLTRTPKSERRWLVEQASSLPCPANNPAKISRSFLAAIDRQDACPTTGSKYPLRSSGLTLRPSAFSATLRLVCNSEIVP
jgi:hypothetical protein